MMNKIYNRFFHLGFANYREGKNKKEEDLKEVLKQIYKALKLEAKLAELN